MTELAYIYDKRESTDDLFDYASNTGTVEHQPLHVSSRQLAEMMGEAV